MVEHSSDNHGILRIFLTTCIHNSEKYFIVYVDIVIIHTGHWIQNNIFTNQIIRFT